MGVGLNVESVKRSTEREPPPATLKKKNHPEPQSFAEAVISSNLRAAEEIARVRVKEEETRERLEKLSRCLVGWWGGGTSPMPYLKTLRRRAWSF